MIQEVLLRCKSASDRGCPSDAVGWVLYTLSDLGAACVRMRAEGRSSVSGAKPVWLANASDIRLRDYSNGHTDTRLVFDVPVLAEAAPEVFGRPEVWMSKPDPGDTAFDLLGDVLLDIEHRAFDSDRLDTRLLERLDGVLRSPVFCAVIDSLVITGARYTSDQPATLSARIADLSAAMRTATPSPQGGRIAGILSTLRPGTHAFGMTLDSGEEIAGVHASEDMRNLEPLLGGRAVVVGTVQFRASGRMLRIDADIVKQAKPDESAIWSQMPRPRGRPLVAAELWVPQDSSSGVAAIIGKWPGDETDEEIEVALRELS